MGPRQGLIQSNQYYDRLQSVLDTLKCLLNNGNSSISLFRGFDSLDLIVLAPRERVQTIEYDGNAR